MPARLVIFLFLLLTGTAKLYMWLGVTDPLKAVIAATLTTFVIICGLRPETGRTKRTGKDSSS